MSSTRPILFLCPSGSLSATGNATTIARLVELLSPGAPILNSDTTTSSILCHAITQYNPRAIVALHAVRSGNVFIDLDKSSLPPIILLLGGTDVNAKTFTKGAELAFSAAVKAATVVVAFSEDLAERFRHVIATLGFVAPIPLIRVIPQSADITDMISTCDARVLLGLPHDSPLALWAGGLRSVKDPLFLLKEWKTAYARGEAPALLLVGPPLDEEIAVEVRQAAGVSDLLPFGGNSGVFLHAPVSRAILLGWLKSANVLINTSLAEGMSNTILEAQAIGTPVVARSCVGNEGIVAHSVTGLLFQTPKECITAVALLCAQEDKTIAERLRTSALCGITAHHSPEVERSAWILLISEVITAHHLPVQSISTPIISHPCYVPYALSSLSSSQRAISRDVVTGLSWIGIRKPFAVVVSPMAITVNIRECTDTDNSLAWGVLSDTDAQRWPVAPQVFDFAGSAESGTASGSIGWGRYWENRGIYSSSEHFSKGGNARTLHLGVDLGARVGESVIAPILARVHSIGNDTSPLGYGPTVMLAHAMSITSSNGLVRRRVIFYTLYGHLGFESVFSADNTPRIGRGTRIEQGEMFASMGSELENGGWFPHVHFQIITEKNCGGWKGDYPGVARIGDAAAYRFLTPDPNLILRCPWVVAQGWEPKNTDESIENVTFDVPTDEELELL